VTVDSLNGGSLGDLAWHAGNNAGIQTGTTSDDVNASFPSNSPPTGFFLTPSGGIVGGTNYTYLLDSGSYQRSSFVIGAGGKAIVTGNVDLYVTGDVSQAPATCGSPPERAQDFCRRQVFGRRGVESPTGRVMANLTVLG
jgi:hypothetical protein